MRSGAFVSYQVVKRVVTQAGECAGVAEGVDTTPVSAVVGVPPGLRV